MNQLEGQLDMFDLLEDRPEPERPVFTVYEMTKALAWPHRCGWCNGKGMLGGGACRWPEDDAIGISYQYCTACDAKHGGPRIGKVWGDRATPLRLVRATEYLTPQQLNAQEA